MRRFAVDELQLPDNDSYTTYVALDRPYVVWNVVATEEFSVDPQSWCFPIAGCVAYRGYFDKAAADRFAKSSRPMDSILTAAAPLRTRRSAISQIRC